MKDTVQKFVEGKYKLNPIAADNLLNTQLQESKGIAREVVGEDTYNAAGENQRAVFDVLAMSTGNDKEAMDSAVNKIAEGNWEGIKDDLKNVPEHRRDSALGFIRAMSKSVFTFRNITDR